jgi:hypothetical protein
VGRKLPTRGGEFRPIISFSPLCRHQNFLHRRRGKRFFFEKNIKTTSVMMKPTTLLAFAVLLVCVSAGDTLGNGQTLDTNGVLSSADNRFHLQVQSDGNVYGNEMPNIRSSTL